MLQFNNKLVIKNPDKPKYLRGCGNNRALTPTYARSFIPQDIHHVLGSEFSRLGCQFFEEHGTIPKPRTIIGTHGRKRLREVEFTTSIPKTELFRFLF